MSVFSIRGGRGFRPSRLVSDFLEVVGEGLLGHFQCRSGVGVAEGDLIEVFVHFEDSVFFVVVLAGVGGGSFHFVLWLADTQ